jgi:hypothetical protein
MGDVQRIQWNPARMGLGAEYDWSALGDQAMRFAERPEPPVAARIQFVPAA